MSEIEVMRNIMLALSDAGVLIFRNNVGCADYKGRKIRYGLCVGSNDLIGIRKRDGRFVAIEVKAPGKFATASQRNFLRQIRLAGGLEGVAHNPQEALEIVGATFNPKVNEKGAFHFQWSDNE